MISERHGVGKAVVETIDGQENRSVLRLDIAPADEIIVRISGREGPGDGAWFRGNGELDALQNGRIAGR